MAETRYTIGERIGAGGMAEVFRAALEGTRGFARPVAVTTEAATRIEDTCATTAPEGTTAPPRTTPTETPQAPAPSGSPPAEQASTSPARVRHRAARPPARGSNAYPYFFTPEAQ